MNPLRTLLFALLVCTCIIAQPAPNATATIQKPKPRTVTSGSCRILSDGTFSGNWGPAELPTLGFTIGPHAAMADAMNANKADFKGPGEYRNEIIALYLGKTAREDTYGGLGTIVLNPDGHSGTFTLNDKSAAGTFDCGAPPKRP